jgi:hypothetical protein
MLLAVLAAPSNQVCRIVWYPAVAVIGKSYVEPAGPAFEQFKLCSVMQWILKTFRIISTVALASSDLLSCNNAAGSAGLGPGFGNGRYEKTGHQKTANHHGYDPRSGFAIPYHCSEANADNRETNARDHKFCLDGEIIVPEEQRPGYPLLRFHVYFVNSPAACKGEVFLKVRVGFIEILRSAIIQNRLGDVFFEKIGVAEVIVELGILYLAVTYYLLVIQYRFFVEPLGLVRVIGC